MKTVNSIKSFLKGNVDEVKELMTAQMKEYAKNLAFEEAGKIRDRIISLDKLFSKQSVTNISDERNIDVFYKHSISWSNRHYPDICAQRQNDWCIYSLFLQIQKMSFWERFVMQFYSNTRQFPELLH